MGTSTIVPEIDIQEQELSPEQVKPRQIHWHRLIVLLSCLTVSLGWGNNISAHQGGTPSFDFGELYFGARTAILHQDPYQPKAVDTVFRHEGGVYPQVNPAAKIIAPIVIQINVYLPTALFLVLPLAHLPYPAAHAFWLALTAILLGIAGYLMWSLADPDGPAWLGWLIAIILADCETMLMAGNASGLVVSLCVIAAWCFLKNRWGAVGVALLAIALVIKPHDAGFVWLFFLLAGGLLRKRALQTLALTAAIGLVTVLWMAPVAPHWVHELHQNSIMVSQTGGTSDPSLAGRTSGGVCSIIDLQSVLSMLIGGPETYNLLAFLILAPLFAICLWITLRKRTLLREKWIGLAAIAPLTLLPVYHRAYDAKLLLLILPAFVILWREGGMRRWWSLATTTAAVLMTSDVPRAIFMTGFEKKTATGYTSVPLTALTPLVILATACFYLWVYWRETHEGAAVLEFRETSEGLVSAS